MSTVLNILSFTFWKKSKSVCVANIFKTTCKVHFSRIAMSEEDITKQKEDPSLLLPPSTVRGMKELDRDLFSKTIVVPWLELNESQVSVAMKYLKRYLLKLINFKPLQPSSIALEGEEIFGDNFEETTSKGCRRRAFLNPSLISTYVDIAEKDRIALKNVNISPNDLHFSKITLRYNNWKGDEILKAILPQDKDCLTSYSIIGHIVHVNVHEHLLPYKTIIGQVLLDKVSGCRTIVNKLDMIDNTYRNFSMELLCGEQNMKTRTRENGCIYELDFSSVYWNPRLATEHERITAKLKAGDVLYDVFAGIGPFSIPAAKKKCHVLANDLNPESYKWLQQNGKLNKVTSFLKAFNKDGKIFLEDDVKIDMLKKWKNKEFKGKSMHITMNLPAVAVSFLPVFNGLFKSEELVQVSNYPTVHVYCFAKGDEPEAIATKMVEENLGVELGSHLLELIQVRNVSPKKEMMRVSFKLWQELLTGCKPDIEQSPEEPPQKRICLLNDEACDGQAEGKQQEQE